MIMGFSAFQIFRSLPVWEEWIEIVLHREAWSDRVRSLPVWEEWIEMTGLSVQYLQSSLFPYGKSGLKYHATMQMAVYSASLFPYGKSGLKSFAQPPYKTERSVSSRMGRVD